MPLKLTITSYQRLSPGQEPTKILDRGSIKIGRATHNDWVLQDPERILSKHHCTVQFQDGAYVLTDHSQNGIFLNELDQRLPKDQAVTLSDGDRFVLGEYEIGVTLQSDTAGLIEAAMEDLLTDVVPPDANFSRSPEQPYPVEARQDASADPLLDVGKPSWEDSLLGNRGGGGFQHYPFRTVPSGEATPSSPDLSSPERINFELPALVSQLSPIKPTPRPTPSTAMDSVDGLATPPPLIAEIDAVMGEPSLEAIEAAAITPPPSQTAAEPSAESASEQIIPEDWWIQPPPSPAAAPLSPPPALQTPAKASVAPPAFPVPQPPGTRPSPPNLAPSGESEPATLGAEALLRAFFEGAGLPYLKLPQEQLPAIMANLGGILHEMVRGLMEILLARSDVKGEFRLMRTAIGPIENNPLKTPPGQPPLSPEQVMTLLLIGQKNAYMPPVQAVREGFDDIKGHQLAVLAGIQAGLNRLLERFDPTNLETRLQQSVLDNLWPANRKAKYWDLFTAEYQAIAREAEDDFNQLFGDEFARAYESHLRSP